MDTPFGKIDTSFLTPAGAPTLSDAFSSFGGGVLQAGQNTIQAVAATYAKAWNPTTGSYQEVSGNTPTGGRPDDGQVVTMPSPAGIGKWMKDHPALSIVGGVLGLGLFYGMYRAFFK